MIGLVAGFTVLATSVGGVAISIASAIVAFFEHARPAWKNRTATKLAASLSVCYGTSLFLYCAEVAPSLLFGSPVYGRAIHVAAGGVSVATHYGSILHIFLLSILKPDVLYDQDSKRQRAPWMSNAVLAFIWLIAGGLGILIMDRACTYIYTIEYVTYRCDPLEDSARLLVVHVTLSGVFLLLSTVLLGYRYVRGDKMSKQEANDSSSSKDLLQLRKDWSILLACELTISASRMIVVAVATAMVTQTMRWHGLGISIILILLDTLALWLYFRASPRALQIYVRIEGAKRLARAASLRRLSRSRRCHSRGSVGSRHSCRDSLRRSRPDVASNNRGGRSGGNRIMPLDVEALERTEVVLGPPMNAHTWHTRGDTTLDHEELMSRRRTVPVVQVKAATITC